MKNLGHIGIVAVSAEGAALCYRTICAEGAELIGPHLHPELSMHTFPLGEYMRQIDAGRWNEVADMMLESAQKLAECGADFLICPDNTAHQAMDFFAGRSPRPWLHIAEEVTGVAATRGFKRVGVLGTNYLMRVRCIRPSSRREESRTRFRRPGNVAESTRSFSMSWCMDVSRIRRGRMSRT